MFHEIYTVVEVGSACILIDKPNKGCTFVEARYTVPVQLDCAESIWFVYYLSGLTLQEREVAT